MNPIIQTVAAGVGSLGFALLFSLKGRHLIPAALGGMLSWALYLLLDASGIEIFFSVFAAGAFASFYSEIVAMIGKAPAILFRIPAFVPLVPGRDFYYTIESAVNRDWAAFRENGLTTLIWVFALAGGTGAVAVFQKQLNNFKNKRKEKREKRAQKR